MRTLSEVGYQKFSLNKKRIRDDGPSMCLSGVPEVDLASPQSIQDARALYDTYQVLLIKGLSHVPISPEKILREVYRDCSDVVEESWSVERQGSSPSMLLPKEFFSKTLSATTEDSWYISFIVQKNQKQIDKFLASLPLQEPPIFCSQSHQLPKLDPKSVRELRLQQHVWSDVTHSSPVWVFCGRNSTSSSIHGRVEHTDSVKHSGTWHYQLSGKKVWNIRPVEESSEWKYGSPTLTRRRGSARCIRGSDGQLRLQLECSAGDILLINTRLWWHSTELPCTDLAKDRLSFSFARDFFFRKPEEHESDVQFTNVDGMYAARNVAAGSIVLTEEELPDCSLERHVDANCEVAVLEDGGYALVARRDICVGDWLTVLPSDSEDDE